MPAVTTKESRLTELQEQILHNAAKPLEYSRALPSQTYTSPDFYEWEVEHIFKKQWLCVGHISQFPKQGDYINLDLMEEPITIARGKDDRIRVLSRVCPHRGMDIMPAEFGHPVQGNRRSFLCPYHHWSYALDGTLLGAPEMHQSKEFDKEQICLPIIRSEIWQGFIFVTFDPNLESVNTHYSELLPFVERWDMGSMEMVANLKWDSQFNWKILVENFMEAYHHLGTHSKTFEPIMPAAGTWTEQAIANGVLCHLPFSKSISEQVKAGHSQCVFPSPSNLVSEDFYEYSILLGTPNFLLFIGPDRVYWYLLLPNSAGEMILHTTLLVTPESKEIDGFERVLEQEIAALKKFHLEDVEVCSAVQKGLRSAVYTPGPLGHLETSIWQFQQYLAQRIRAEKIKAQKITEGSR